MYYNNKSTFYVKQYGPTVLIIVISVLLIFVGVYAYLSSTKLNTKQNELVAKTEVKVSNENNKSANIETNSLKVTEEVNESNVNTEENIEIATQLDQSLQSIQSLEKLVPGKVLKINQNNNIIIEINGKNYETELVGIDYSKSASNITERLTNDLVNKNVTISFDKLKVEDNKIPVYLYLDNELYNSLLLKQGLAIVKVEKVNTNLLDTLIESQKFAKTNLLGIWKK